MEGNFLENLKKAVETGEFNSDAAKKIIEINKLADNKINRTTKIDLEKSIEDLEKSIEDKLKIGGIRTVSEEEAKMYNSQYEEKMQEITKTDAENKRIADLIDAADNQLSVLTEIEDMVKLSINDMMTFVEELKQKFSKEFEEKNSITENLLAKINEVNTKYNI